MYTHDKCTQCYHVTICQSSLKSVDSKLTCSVHFNILGILFHVNVIISSRFGWHNNSPEDKRMLIILMEFQLTTV